MAEKVLVVDDERQIRDLLGEFLEREGYSGFPFVIFGSSPDWTLGMWITYFNPHFSS